MSLKIYASFTKGFKKCFFIKFLQTCRNYDNHKFNSLTDSKLYLFNGTFKALVQQNVRQDKYIIHSMQIEGNIMTLCMLLSLHWSNYNDFITRNHLIARGNSNEFPCSYNQCFAYQDKQYLYNDTYWREIIILLAFGFRISVYIVNISLSSYNILYNTIQTCFECSKYFD